jgi:hypothetical protein
LAEELDGFDFMPVSGQGLQLQGQLWIQLPAQR